MAKFNLEYTSFTGKKKKFIARPVEAVIIINLLGATMAIGWFHVMLLFFQLIF